MLKDGNGQASQKQLTSNKTLGFRTMNRRGASLLPCLLLIPLALSSACTVAERSAASGPVLRGGMGRGRVRSIRMQLSQARNRISELESALAERGDGGDGGRVNTLEARQSELMDALAQAQRESATLRDQLAAARAETAAGTGWADGRQ